MRAIFRAVTNGRQVAVLAPTTILAAQHWRSIRMRMPYDVSVGLLRAGNTRMNHNVKESLANSTTDIVVGTHSLLNRKVSIPRLGLLVIDEEQRFGVQQKEILKQIDTGVDVLTLSATPIPRTLHMSLSGIRDLSTIFTPPEGRRSITTYVMQSSDDVIRQAITRELRRGGQVFYVVPRISDIQEEMERILRLVRGVDVKIAHSKISNLEDLALEFADGIGDILLATQVIESGLDMPNVNSIIIQSSHRFGLSTLYQMSGRVGRRDVPAFAYLLYPDRSVLTRDARRRLTAMRELSYLGSGFELAQRDLEIRGCGNVFGTDQSGDAMKIGYDLYMNLLENSIAIARSSSIKPVLKCDFNVGYDLGALGSIPDTYIENNIDRQHEISRIQMASSYAELMAIGAEWYKRYGPMPSSTKELVKFSHIHTACKRLGVSCLISV